MFHTIWIRRAAQFTAVLAILGMAPAGLAADETDDLERLIQDRAEAIVTVKYVTRMSLGVGGGSEQETESEAPGVMIDPGGLVLCSNTQLNGIMGLLGRFMRNIPGMNLSSDVTDITVLIGSDETEHDAKLIARDPDLDLAWVQIQDPQQTFKSVDLSQAAEARLGQRLICVRRLGKYFDRSPAVRTFMVSGVTRKPRKLWIPQEQLTTTMGLPAFTSAGEPVGVVVLQMPDAEDTGGAFNPLAMLGSMSQLQESMAGVILPAEAVVRATQQAREAAGESDEGD